MKHTIQVLVENKFGVLARIASLFSARGYNIDSLAVGETHDPGISCMTIVVNTADEKILEQIKKQLHKLIDVITVIDFTHKDYIDRELFLVKLVKNGDSKKNVEKLVQEQGATVIEEADDRYILEFCIDRHRAEDLLNELKNAGISELIRTGRIAIGK